MRILVTGGKGQLGSEFEGLDLPDYIEIIALGRDGLDIVDAKSIARAFAKHQPDLLINAAAYTAVDKAESEPEVAFEINEVAVGLLADACAAAQIPMFHISTDYVFDGEKAEPYQEDDPVNPISVYGKSKEAGERALRDRLEKHLILRASWIFGKNGTNFVKTIVRLAGEGKQINVVDDQIGGPTSANSLARCLIAFAARYNDDGTLVWGTYHFSQLPYVSWYSFATEILKSSYDIGLFGSPITLYAISSSRFPTIAPRPRYSCLCVERIGTKVDPARVHHWHPDLRSVLLKIKNGEC